MNRPAVALGGCVLIATLGCGKSVDPPVDPARAEAVLLAALESWKRGDAHGELQKRSPPIYFNEREWEAGKKLLDFKLGPVELMGRQGRCSVKLSLQDRGGKVTEREISYLIDTAPNVVITREGLGP
jgi:hypothetical protein